MKIIYRPHLKRRIKERLIPSSYPSKIYKKSKTHYFDILTKHYIAFSKLKYSGRQRTMVIS